MIEIIQKITRPCHLYKNKTVVEDRVDNHCLTNKYSDMQLVRNKLVKLENESGLTREDIIKVLFL